MSDQLMTVKEVAELMWLRPQTIYVMVMRKQITYLKVSTGALRFDPDEIKGFLEDKKQPVLQGS